MAREQQQDSIDEERLRFALEAANEGLWDYDPTSGEMYFSPRFYTMLGYEQGDFAPSYEAFVELIHPDSREQAVCRFEEVAWGSAQNHEVELRLRTKSGGWRWILCRCRVLQRSEGTARLVGVHIDVTEQRLVEQALRASEDRYRELIESQGEGIGIVNEEERFTFANPAAGRIFGLPVERLQGRSLREFVDAEQFEAVLQQTNSRQQGEQGTYELAFHPADRPDERRTMLITAAPRTDGEGRYKGAFGIFRDITERKQMEDALREEQQRYRQLFESLPHGVAVLQGNMIALANAAAIQMIGCADLAELRDLRPLELLVPEERERVKDLLGGIVGGSESGPVHYISRAQRTDASEFVVEAVATAITHKGAPAVQLFMMDVTERHRAEAQRGQLAEQLRQAQKMESVGRLAGGIAHDFNNLLSPIIIYSDLALMELPEGDGHYEHFKSIRAAATRAKLLIQQLLAFGRKQVLRVRTLDLNTAFSEAEEMLRRLIREDIAIEVDLAPELGCVRADPTQVQQILMNLILNARDSMVEGGALRIATRDVELREGDAGFDPDLRPGPYVLLEVSDTGRGMDAETLDHIFEPFFSTKDKGKGTGLGLSTVHGIVKQHEGYITAQSEPGRGAIFRVYLPRAPESAPPRDTPATPVAGLRFDETVLVVEDDEVVRQQVCRILERQGFTVLAAGDGDEALALVDKHHGTIELLLTDVIMPGMNGRELYRQLRERQPKTRAVYMSGYADDVIAEHGVLGDQIHFVQKPFTVAELIDKIIDALELGSSIKRSK
jgi:two-component system, cell cycle sensor histidine kinase and response regulator CckA